MTVLSPFISAIRVRQLGQRLRWSSTRSRRLAPSSLPRYARNSWRNSGTDGLPVFGYLLPNARPRRLDRAGVHVFRSHLVVMLVPNGLRTSRISFLPDRVARKIGLSVHFSLQPLPDSVEPDRHVVLLYLEHPRPTLQSTAPRRDAAETGSHRQLSKTAMARRSCSFSRSGGCTACSA